MVVRRGRSGPLPVRRSGPGLARLADGGKGGVYIQLSGDYTARIKPLRRGWRAVPASCLAEFGAPVFNRRFNPPGNSSPASPLAPVRSWPGAGAGRLRLWSSGAGRRRGPSPPCCRSGPPAGSAPRPARSFSRAGPPAVPVRRGSVRSAGPGPALARSWPPVRRGPPVPLPVHSGAAISESNRDFSAPYTGPKISSDFSGEVFYARGLSLDSWYINAPL